MAIRLRQFIDLRAQEGKLVLLAGATLFCIVAAHIMLETARDTLFLLGSGTYSAELGENQGLHP